MCHDMHCKDFHQFNALLTTKLSCCSKPIAFCYSAIARTWMSGLKNLYRCHSKLSPLGQADLFAKGQIGKTKQRFRLVLSQKN